jgi:hypothetical protein
MIRKSSIVKRSQPRRRRRTKDDTLTLFINCHGTYNHALFDLRTDLYSDYALARCICGNHALVSVTDLKTGRITCCGRCDNA